MDDNESEFGFAPCVFWKVPLYSKMFLQVGADGDIIFSEPKWTFIPGIFLGLGIQWW